MVNLPNVLRRQGHLTKRCICVSAPYPQVLFPIRLFILLMAQILFFTFFLLVHNGMRKSDFRIRIERTMVWRCRLTIKPTLKAPGTKRLKLKKYGLLSNVAFEFNLRRFIMVNWYAAAYIVSWTGVIKYHGWGATAH